MTMLQVARLVCVFALAVSPAALTHAEEQLPRPDLQVDVVGQEVGRAYQLARPVLHVTGAQQRVGQPDAGLAERRVLVDRVAVLDERLTRLTGLLVILARLEMRRGVASAGGRAQGQNEDEGAYRPP